MTFIDPNSPREEEYIRGLKASGLKKSDKVLMFRKAAGGEGGWRNSWLDYKNQFIGKIVTISEGEGVAGFQIEEDEHGYHYPWFIFEQIEKIKKKEVIISGEAFFLPECIIKLL